MSSGKQIGAPLGKSSIIKSTIYRCFRAMQGSVENKGQFQKFGKALWHTLGMYLSFNRTGERTGTG